MLSERQFCEQLRHNLLFRWFLDMDMSGERFDASTFSQNQERLIQHDAARLFFHHVFELSREYGWASDDHFTVDGTLIEAAASMKSFVQGLGAAGIEPHVAQRKVGERIDPAVAGSEGCRVSQRMRKRVEEIFGWAKTVGGFRRTRHLGIGRTQLSAHFVGAAYNLVRMAGLLMKGASGSPPERMALV